MDTHTPLSSVLFFLVAAVIAVPLFRRIKLGAILGYLVAGMALGPWGFNFISNPESILHFSEIGVVLLLFVIGLEMNPVKLWSMRHHIVGLGIGQLLISASVIAGVGWILIENGSTAIVIGLALGLSSTAFAIQLMAEKRIIAKPSGRAGFAILLLQDLAVIPILFLVDSLSNKAAVESVPWYWSILAIAALLLVGKFLLNPFLKLISRYGSRESMTAASLLIVVGAAVLMLKTGLSMGLGAFIAGILLANSSFRHQLESDIEPFKGLTLGLFFIAIGMTLNLDLFLKSPFMLLLAALALMAFKTSIIMVLMTMAKIHWRRGIKVGLMLSQGGEFAFVVMAQAGSSGVIPIEVASHINLIVGLSMALTSPLVAIISLAIKPPAKATPELQTADYDDEPEVLILGFGRFGQTTGRILAANKIPFTAIDRDAEHIDFVTRFGNKVHYGDATRLDVLEAAGIDSVRVVLVAVDDYQEAETIVSLIKEQHPKVKVIARARNRAAFWSLSAAGADQVVREMFKSSLDAATFTLTEIGYSDGEAIRTIERFSNHDNSMVRDSIKHRDDLAKLIEVGRQGRADLERLFQQDQEK
ncbi:monovalent cation:proton antiporter-2 (CPA2) family protein [Pleionea sediminis]|uniref:monovalent cation:proton antiporter-2 (CPA2) family protein n=1 Tax=Pleionea sediminis TaxID=2569479 RepID=UPI001185C1BD|nr:monovalent cation:proton antiporter-2 (CPA2) family protein [Pleionea sediminis]